MSKQLIQDLSVRIGANYEAFSTAVQNVRRQANQLQKDLGDTGEKLSRSLTAPVAALAAGLGVLTKKAMDYGGAIDDMSIRTGLSRKKLQELQFVTNQLGINFEAVGNASRDLMKRVADVATGQGRAAVAAQALGFQVKDSAGQMRGMDELLPELINKLSQVENPTHRNALAMELLGRSAYELIPLLDAGAGQIDALSQKARELGLVMADDDVVALAQFGDVVDQAVLSVQALGHQIAVAFLPVAQALVSLMNNGLIPAVRGMTQWFRELDPVWRNIIVLTAGLAAAIGPLLIVLSKLGAALKFVLLVASPLVLKIGLIVAAFATAAFATQAIIDTLDEFGFVFKTIMMNLERWVLAAVRGILSAFSYLPGGLGATASAMSESVSTMIADLDRELSGRGQFGLGDAFAKLGANFVDNMRGAWDGVSNLFRTRSAELEAIPMPGGADPTTTTGERSGPVDPLTEGLYGQRQELGRISKSGLGTPSTPDFSGLQPAVSGLSAETAVLNLQLENTMRILDSMGVRTWSVFEGMAEAATRFGETLMSVNAESIQSLGDYVAAVAAAAKETIGSMIREAVVATISRALATSPIPPPFNFGIAAAAGLGAEAIFQKAVSGIKIPAFAEGGIVSGPTLGLMGEYPGASTNPEIIAPLDKLQQLIGGGLQQVRITGEFRMHGADLVAVVDQTTNNQRRTYRRY